jgi:dihydroorotate dehydrogenase (NAD+) catalytic subunit
MLRGFAVLSDAVAEFETYLCRKKISARDLIGCAADARKPYASLPPLQDKWKDYVPKQ